MRLSDINPYLRYVKRASFSPIDGEVSTYDCRLFYFLDGPHKIIVESKDYIAQQNTLMLWQSGTIYRFSKTCRNSDIIVLNFDYTQNQNQITHSIYPEYINKFKKEKILEHLTFSDCSILNQPLILNDAQFILTSLKKIVEEHQRKKIFYEEKSSGIFKNILTEIIRQNSFLPKALDKIDVIIDYIQNHYGEEITNQTLGELISYHPYYINRLMRNTTGTTLHQYLLNFRIDVAKRLLITSEISISDIATQCGFKSFSYFSNCFKAKTGYTPLLFRKEKRLFI